LLALDWLITNAPEARWRVAAKSMRDLYAAERARAEERAKVVANRPFTKPKPPYDWEDPDRWEPGVLPGIGERLASVATAALRGNRPVEARRLAERAAKYGVYEPLGTLERNRRRR